MTHTLHNDDDPCRPPPPPTHDNLASDSTIQSQLSALDQRAIGWTRCTKFEWALRDTDTMQQLLPSSAQGYLREAWIYSQQGKQRDAIAICDKVLRLGVVNTHDPDYHKLEQARMDAMQQDSKRIDFINQLPVDIVVTMLVPMFMNGFISDAAMPCPYLYVSRRWRDLVIQGCHGGLSFGIGYGQGCEGKAFEQIVQFAHHTTALYVKSCTQGTCLGELLRYGDLRSLERLVIESFKIGLVKHFTSSLRAVSTTLTHFSVYIDRSYRLCLADVVSNCTTLVSLKMVNPYDTNCDSLPIAATYPTLKTLRLMQAIKDITHDNVLGILKRFPSLQQLELDPCPHMQSVLDIPEHYPWMQSLDLFYDDERMEIKAGEQHHQTLVDVELKLKGGIQDGDDALYTISYPCLKRLSVSFISDMNPCFGWWIPSKARALEELRMMISVIKARPAILDTKPPNLKRLVMRLGDVRSSEEAAIASYIDYYARQKERSHLRDLEIHLYSEHFSLIHEAICRLNHLQHLMIGFTFEWDTSNMDRFVKQLVNGCPHLVFLDINNKKALSIDSLNLLKRLDSLEELVLSIDGMQGCIGFCEALQTLSPSLKCIQMFPKSALDPMDLESLKTSRPDLKIVVKNYGTLGWG